MLCLYQGRLFHCCTVLRSGAKLKSDQAPLFRATPKCPFDALSGKSFEYAQLREELVSGIADLLDMDMASAKKQFGTHSLRRGGATKAAERRARSQASVPAGWRSNKSMDCLIKEKVLPTGSA